ncbi:MAG: hypothetical protein ABIV63_07775 [Caldimonas sp.]
MEFYDQSLSAFGGAIDDIAEPAARWECRHYVPIKGTRVASMQSHYNLRFNVFFES